jgi:hypothetical protein
MRASVKPRETKMCGLRWSLGELLTVTKASEDPNASADYNISIIRDALATFIWCKDFPGHGDSQEFSFIIELI